MIIIWYCVCVSFKIKEAPLRRVFQMFVNDLECGPQITQKVINKNSTDFIRNLPYFFINM